ncbi:MAG: hypothetical protein OXU77_01510 [Gammaproteobacteria bacterium]|nr:hypothetical protein [Gammaproteobacteria bacterium]MDE0443891.1 hypothetical protein [Gammaproteobacteria bacterium]
MISFGNPANRMSPGPLAGCRDSRWRRDRGIGDRCVALFALVAVLAPFPLHAGEAGIDVPMRRDVRATVRDRVDAEPVGVLPATEMLLGEIGILRRELGVDDFPARAEPQGNRQLIHVYVKSMEVMSKVVAAQRRLGVAESSVPDMPVDEVSSEDVLRAVQDALDGVRGIKTQMVIETEAEARASSGPLTLAAAYTNLADASVLLDGLRGRATTPSDVHRNLGAVIEDMSLIAARLQVTLDMDPPVVDGAKESVDVAQQALRAVYKIVLLQGRLGMDASAVPTLTMVRVTPAEAYDLTGVLRAELARIKWHLGINVPSTEGAPTTQSSNATDVFARMLLVVRNLEQLTAGAAT